MKTDFLVDTHCHLSLTDDIDSILNCEDNLTINNEVEKNLLFS